MSGICKITTLLLCFIVGSVAQAQVSVDRAVFSFAAKGDPVEDVTVTNSGSDALFVTVVPERILNAGTDKEERVATEELIASPRRFSLSAGGQRSVRFVSRIKAGSDEHVFRIKLLPQTESFEKQVAQGGKQTMLKVLFSVGMLVFVNPLEPSVQLSWERKGDELVFNNKGNVNILLEEGTACLPDTSASECLKLPANRLYPGQSWTVPASARAVVSFRRQSIEGYETIVSPPK